MSSLLAPSPPTLSSLWHWFLAWELSSYDHCPRPSSTSSTPVGMGCFLPFLQLPSALRILIPQQRFSSALILASGIYVAIALIVKYLFFVFGGPPHDVRRACHSSHSFATLECCSEARLSESSLTEGLDTLSLKLEESSVALRAEMVHGRCPPAVSSHHSVSRWTRVPSLCWRKTQRSATSQS